MAKEVTAPRIGRYAITIPANTGTGSRVKDLLVAAGMPLPGITPRSGTDGAFTLGIAILGTQPASTTARAAFDIASPRYDATGQPAAITGTDFTLHGERAAAGVDYYEPADGDLDSYVRSTDGNTVAALAIVYLL